MGYFLTMGIMVLIDQVSKYYAILYLSPIKMRKIINNFFHITLVKNTGAAYGLLKNRPKLIIGITLPMIIWLNYYLMSLLKYDGMGPLKLAYASMAAGGLSNFIDRIKYGYVIDFLYIKYKRAPIFNIADIYIFLGAMVIIYFELFTGAMN